ncbi:hypothetical protein ACGFSD_12500 [Streptomyces caniferus]|uniref:hypothetical protein n=1 Tax=Streptomyces caniferus TaxID=285557 RepID=UPI0033D841EF
MLAEVIHPKINDAVLRRPLPRLWVEATAQAIAQPAAILLRTAGLHGPKCATDARLCATALIQPGHLTILVSDVDGIALPTADRERPAVGVPSGAQALGERPRAGTARLDALDA